MPNKPVDINTDTKNCKIQTCENDSMPGSKKCEEHNYPRGHVKRTEQEQRAAEAANL